MRLLLLALIAGLPLCSQSTYAAQPTGGAMPLVERGFAAYLKEGATAAVQAWLKGSALEGNTQATSQANILKQVEDYYGKPQALDVLREIDLSSRSEVVYIAIDYDKGISYAKFYAYKKSDGSWVLTSFLFNTEAAQILPSSMLDK